MRTWAALYHLDSLVGSSESPTREVQVAVGCSQGACWCVVLLGGRLQSPRTLKIKKHIVFSKIHKNIKNAIK